MTPAALRIPRSPSLEVADGALESAIFRQKPSQTRLVIDAGVLRSKGSAELQAVLNRWFATDGLGDFVSIEPGDVTLPRILAEAERWSAMSPLPVLVAVGGGSTIDFAALVLAQQAGAELHRRVRGRGGLVPLDTYGRRPSEFIASPTTLGTGAEASMSACFENEGDKFLAVGPVLRPDEAVLDSRATAGLGPGMVGEALLEVIARVLVPLAGPREGEREANLRSAIADPISLGLLSAARDLVPRATAQDVTTSTRLALATLSSCSHMGWSSFGRSPWSSPVWFLATELSMFAGISKVSATAAILPAWCERVQELGDSCWGFEDALRMGLAALGVENPCGSDEFSRLVRSLSTQEALESTVDMASEVTRRALRRWGAGLPMLGSHSRAEVEHVLRRAVQELDRGGTSNV